MNARLALLLSVTCACADPPPPAPAAPTQSAAPLDIPPMPSQQPATTSKTSTKDAPPPPHPSGGDEDDPLPRDVAAAEQAFQEAKVAMARGNLQEARTKFRLSLRLDYAVGTLLNLAMVEEQLGGKDAAIRHFQAAYDDSMKQGRTDRAAVAKSHIDALRAKP